MEFTLNELMELHQALISFYCDPESTRQVNGTLLDKLIDKITELSTKEKQS